MDVDVLVEGLLDEEIARTVLLHCNHRMDRSLGEKNGWHSIRRRITAFNQAAAVGAPILVLVDAMDTVANCPVKTVAEWVPDRHRNLLLRFVQREIESWLLADSEAIADFFGVAPRTIPVDPERLPDPKQAYINVARRCRNRSRRESIVPRNEERVGRLYTSETTELIKSFWRVERARHAAPSLDRTCLRLEQFV